MLEAGPVQRVDVVPPTGPETAPQRVRSLAQSAFMRSGRHRIKTTCGAGLWKNAGMFSAAQSCLCAAQPGDIMERCR